MINSFVPHLVNAYKDYDLLLADDFTKAFKNLGVGIKGLVSSSRRDWYSDPNIRF